MSDSPISERCIVAYNARGWHFLMDTMATVAAALMTIAAAPLDALVIPIRAAGKARLSWWS